MRHRDHKNYVGLVFFFFYLLLQKPGREKHIIFPHLCSMFCIPFSTNAVSVGGSECFDKTFFLSLLFFPAWSTGPAARRERRERGPHTYKIDTNTCLFRPHYAALHNVKKAPPGRGYEKRVGLGNLSLLLSLFIWFLYISFGLLPFFYTWCGAVP